jgi:hypothetical protein
LPVFHSAFVFALQCDIPSSCIIISRPLILQQNPSVSTSPLNTHYDVNRCVKFEVPTAVLLKHPKIWDLKIVNLRGRGGSDPRLRPRGHGGCRCSSLRTYSMVMIFSRLKSVVSTQHQSKSRKYSWN